MKNDEQAIRELIATFNTAWQSGRLDIAAPLLDPEVVFVAPGLEQELVGREACLVSLEDYGKHAQTLVFDPEPAHIRIWGDTCNAIFTYAIVYQVGQAIHQEQGQEVWTLRKTDGKWVLVWRALVAYGPREKGSRSGVQASEA